VARARLWPGPCVDNLWRLLDLLVGDGLGDNVSPPVGRRTPEFQADVEMAGWPRDTVNDESIIMKLVGKRRHLQLLPVPPSLFARDAGTATAYIFRGDLFGNLVPVLAQQQYGDGERRTPLAPTQQAHISVFLR
jgi:hypothetical protein